MSHIKFIHAYDTIISIENLLEAWKEFVKGKKKRKDVQRFQLHLMDNIIDLHIELKTRIYAHDIYERFIIFEPKRRDINKASVRDRLLHRAIYRKLYLFFDRTFISDSYSCRLGKGTHKALLAFTKFNYIVSENNTKQCWVLKCDIRKFFASIDHKILVKILEKYIQDRNIIWLLCRVVDSFSSTEKGKGLPLGNLTSQLFANIYMNVFDQFIKHKIKAKYYIRYADDFVIFSQYKKYLENILITVNDFLEKRLELSLHPDKVFIKTISSGVDYLGWVHFPDHKVLRTVTKKRMFKKIKQKQGNTETVQSYVGLLKHGNTYKIRQKLIKYATFNTQNL